MDSRRSAVDSKLVLYGDDLDVVDVQVISRTPIRIEFLLVNLEMNLRRIIVALGPIIHGSYEAIALRKLPRDSFANIRGKSSYPTLSWHIVAEERYPVNI